MNRSGRFRSHRRNRCRRGALLSPHGTPRTLTGNDRRWSRRFHRRAPEGLPPEGHRRLSIGSLGGVALLRGRDALAFARAVVAHVGQSALLLHLLCAWHASHGAARGGALSLGAGPRGIDSLCLRCRGYARDIRQVGARRVTAAGGLRTRHRRRVRGVARLPDVDSRGHTQPGRGHARAHRLGLVAEGIASRLVTVFRGHLAVRAT